MVLGDSFDLPNVDRLPVVPITIAHNWMQKCKLALWMWPEMDGICLVGSHCHFRSSSSEDIYEQQAVDFNAPAVPIPTDFKSVAVPKRRAKSSSVTVQTYQRH